MYTVERNDNEIDNYNTETYERATKFGLEIQMCIWLNLM